MSFDLKVKREEIGNIYRYVIIVLMLLCSGTPLQSLYNKQLSLALFFSTLLLLYLKRDQLKKTIKRSGYVVLLSAIFLLTMLVNKDSDFFHYVGVIIALISAYLFAQLVEKEEFIHKYVNIITVIALYSSVITLIANINLGWAGTLPLLTSGSSEWRHIGIFQYFWGWNQWITVMRNSACFREPGVWGCYSCLALLFHMQSIKKYSSSDKKERISIIVKFCVLFVGVLTSLSTTAILCLALCVVIYFFEVRKLNALSIGLIGVGVAFIAVFRERLFAKFSKASQSFISFQERLDGAVAGIENFYRNPLLGSGYTTYISGIQGTSANAFVDILGKYGIVTMIILAGGLVKFVRTLQLSRISKIAAAASMIIMLISQNLFIYPFFLCMVFYGLLHKKEQAIVCPIRGEQEMASEKERKILYKPLISIVVPVYNVEKYVQKCIESIINQTYKNLEILLIDDGSSDSSGKICDEMAKKDSRIIVIHNENGGASVARNTGIRMAKGEYIGFVDSDDYIEPDMYQKLITANIRYGAQVSMCGRFCEKEGTDESYELFTTNKKVMTAQGAVHNLLLQRESDSAPWDKLCKAELFKNVRYPVGVIHEDLSVIVRLLAQSTNVVHVGIPLYHYNIRKGSTCTQPFSVRRFDVYEQACVARDFVKKHLPGEEKAADCFVLGNVKTLLYSAASSNTCESIHRKRIKEIMNRELAVCRKNSYVPISEKLELYKTYVKIVIKSVFKSRRQEKK